MAPPNLAPPNPGITIPLADLKRGEVVAVDLQGALGFEKMNDANSGLRSCVVVQNNHGNSKSPLTIVVPLTDLSQSKGYAFQVTISGSVLGPGGKDCIADCGHIRSIDKVRIKQRFAVLPDGLMRQIDDALRLLLELPAGTGNVIRGLRGRR